MGDIERLSLKKIFVGKAMLFGLVFGAFMGIIIALLLEAAIFLSSRSETFMPLFNLIAGNSGTVPSPLSLVMFVPAFAIFSVLLFGVCALLYNLASYCKVNLDFGFEDMGVVAKKLSISS